MNASTHIIQREGNVFSAPDIRLEKTRNGQWTGVVLEGAAHFYLHSRYDPVLEAERFVSTHLSYLSDEKLKRLIVYGLGCGHHVRALLQHEESADLLIEVWETNVQSFLHMESLGLFDDLMEERRLTFVVSENVQVFAERMKGHSGTDTHIIVHAPSLKSIPATLNSFKSVLQQYLIQQNSAIVQNDQLEINFSQNTQKIWPSISTFKELPSVPFLLISAGPSLTKSLPLLKEAAKHCLLGAVGTVAALLRRCGICPDFVVMTDPQPGMLRQLEGWDSDEIPLFFLSTLFAGVVEQYRGPKFILYQAAYTPSERKALELGEPLVHTGGSVSTTLFSFARLLGAEPICLIGQDLAYTDDKTHVEGTPLFASWQQQAKGERVLSFDRTGTVISPANLLIYKKWFEQQAQNSEEIFYNATEGGAYIEGFTHLTLADFLSKVNATDITEVRDQFRTIVQSAS